MATTVNGKVYTSHPLMDEIVYNCKLILKTIVVKNDVLANDYEDESFIDRVEGYMMVRNGNATFAAFPFDEEILTAFGYDINQVSAIMVNRNNVPESDRDALLEFSCNWYLDNYEEQNDYYRSLNGKPPYGTTEYNIYLDRSYFPANYKKEIDFTKPVHEFDNMSISVLQVNGVIDSLKENHKGFNYSYLDHLGDYKIDVYKARTAGKYDILYAPKTETIVDDRFNELYNYNKEMYLQRVYSEAYAYSSEYYEQCIILSIIAQTFNDMIVDVPEWYIRRDIFDLRSVQYFLDSYGVQYFKEIPLKYQIRIVKNLNKLIKYKSSNKNFDDILEIFDLKDTSIYKYYLYKKRLVDQNGNYVVSDNDKDKYELEFVQAKINDSYDDYIKDMIYRSSYDSITLEDKYWDSEDSHEYVKNKHLARDFTIESTKYMSLEYKISMSDYLFQMEYFMGLVMDSKIDSEGLKVMIPSIESGINFELNDLFLFLCLLTFGYNNSDTTIRRPVKSEDEIYDILPGMDTQQEWENNSEWLKYWTPELFVSKGDRVYGYNPSVNLDEVADVIGRNHSAYQFYNGYTLKDFGVDTFKMPKTISTFDELTSTYFNNKECYDNLKKIIEDETDTSDKYKTGMYVFEQLFTKTFDYESYQVEDNNVDKLETVLQDRDYILYEKYYKMMSESNIETRQDNIRAIMNDIINTLEYYISAEGLEYAFAFSTISSFQSLVHYIYLLINFFKSYKVYFLDPYISYSIDNKMDNYANGYDSIKERKLTYYDRRDKLFSRDSVNRSLLYNPVDNSKDTMMEILDISSHFDPDPFDDYDYNGKYPDSDESGETFKMADGGLVDKLQTIPYIMLDGGNPQLGKLDLWDLNGANPNNIDDYLDLDGGYTDDLEEYRKDYWRTAYNYIIDGGAPGTNQFITNSTRLQIVDNQITADIRFSKMTGNQIVEKDDGLYLKQIWVDWKTFQDFKEESQNVLDYFTSTYNSLIQSVTIIDDEIINNSIDDVLSNMRLFVSYMKDDKFENNMNQYVDEGISSLYADFENFSPYNWDKF